MKQMNYDLRCPACSKELKCPPKLVGRETSCPSCKSALKITKPEAVLIESCAPVVTETSGNWEFDETAKSIDDSIVRVAHVSLVNRSSEIPARFYFRTTLQNRRVTTELYFGFLKKMFSIRDSLNPARIRVDQNQPLNIPISSSETGNVCFLGETWELLNQLQNANQLICELQLMRHGTKTFKFDVSGFAEIHQTMFGIEVATNWMALQEFNREIVEHVLGMGPKNLVALVEALTRTKCLPQDQMKSSQQKSTALFAAAQQFGEKFRVSEIHGTFTGDEINDPFVIAVLDNLSSETREAADKLFVHD